MPWVSSRIAICRYWIDLSKLKKNTRYGPAMSGKARAVQKHEVCAGMSKSERIEECLAFDTLVLRNGSQNSVQCSDAKVLVRRYSDAVVGWLFALQDDVATLLVNNSIAPGVAEGAHKITTTDIAWNFHPLARTSSRTRWRRIVSGGCAWSK